MVEIAKASTIPTQPRQFDQAVELVMITIEQCNEALLRLDSKISPVVANIPPECHEEIISKEYSSQFESFIVAVERKLVSLKNDIDSIADRVVI